MLALHQLPPLDRAASLSPFCTKVETYLRMTATPYTDVRELDTSASPKGKLPYIVDADLKIGDSYFIIDHLKATRGDTLDIALSAAERAVGHATMRMLDEHLYWAIVHSRWLDERFSPRMQEMFLGGVPSDQRPAVTSMVLDGMRATLHAHGLGRHTPAEIAVRASADIDAIAALLGGKPYFGGMEPSTADAAVYAFTSSLVDVDMDTALRRCALAHANLVAHAARMRARYYPEL
jgi:glutathione S-transferase